MRVSNKSMIRLVVFTLIVSMSSLIFAGCNGEDDGDKPPEQTAMTIQDIFPLDENVMYEFEGNGNEFATFTVFNEYIDEGMVQQRVDNGGTVMARVFKVSNGKVTRTLSKAETYYREDMMDQTEDSQEVLLMEPIEKAHRGS